MSILFGLAGCLGRGDFKLIMFGVCLRLVSYEYVSGTLARVFVSRVRARDRTTGEDGPVPGVRTTVVYRRV